MLSWSPVPISNEQKYHVRKIRKIKLPSCLNDVEISFEKQKEKEKKSSLKALKNHAEIALCV